MSQWKQSASEEANRDTEGQMVRTWVGVMALLLTPSTVLTTTAWGQSNTGDDAAVPG